MRLDHLKGYERKYIEDLVDVNMDVFHLPMDELPVTDLLTHHVNTTDDEPINTRQHKFPHASKDVITQQVQDLLTSGIIRPSESAWGTPLWCVPKHEDAPGNPRWQLVLDFHALNEKTVPNSYPIPNIASIFYLNNSSKQYSKCVLFFPST